MVLDRRVLIGFGAIVVVAIVVVGWWLLSPLFIDTTVQEDFPFAANATVPTGMTLLQVEQAMAGIAMVNSDNIQDSMTDLMMKATGSDTADMSDLINLGTGSFRDADSVHKGSGTATIYEGPDGSRVLRLEDFDGTNGPDLHVIISPTANPETQEEVSAPGYINLGKLKGNVGNQNYIIPDGVEIPENGSVVIYCRAFHVIFSTATLES